MAQPITTLTPHRLCAYSAEQARRSAQLKRIKLRYFIEPLVIFIAIMLSFYVLGKMQARDDMAAQIDTAADCQAHHNPAHSCHAN